MKKKSWFIHYSPKKLKISFEVRQSNVEIVLKGFQIVIIFGIHPGMNVNGYSIDDEK